MFSESELSAASHLRLSRAFTCELVVEVQAGFRSAKLTAGAMLVAEDIFAALHGSHVLPWRVGTGNGKERR